MKYSEIKRIETERGKMLFQKSRTEKSGKKKTSNVFVSGSKMAWPAPFSKSKSLFQPRFCPFWTISANPTGFSQNAVESKDERIGTPEANRKCSFGAYKGHNAAFFSVLFKKQ